MSRRQNPLTPVPNAEHGNWAVLSLIGSATKFRDNGYPQECKESLLMAIRILFQWRLRESEESHAHCRLEELSILADRLKALGAIDTGAKRTISRSLRRVPTDQLLDELYRIARDYAHLSSTEAQA